MEQAIQALQALYSSPDPAIKKQADDWLTQFQQTPPAWQLADQILSNGETPIEYRFFAAQTMRTKVQFDFYELPADSYGSLRDSLLNHIDRFRAPEFQAIHTMLAITIADLVIQADSAWADAFTSLFQRYGGSPDSFATLLEILRMLPEENTNQKLMTDGLKRSNSRERLMQAAPQVVQFLLNIQCPSVQAKKRVLECFLAWIEFGSLQPGDVVNNSLIPECFKFVNEGGDLSETSTDIVCEILRMSSEPLCQPAIQAMLPHIAGLKPKFEELLKFGAEQAVEQHTDELLQICRIYVETGECLIPLIMEQSTNPEVQGILKVILQCTGLPSQEISAIPLDFWNELGREVCRRPEMETKMDQFQGLYAELLSVTIRQCTVPMTEDPFQADDEYTAHRNALLGLVEDCLRIMTPNAALEHVLKSLQDGQGGGVNVQEAHFFCLTTVGARAQVCPDSVLWHLIQSLPPLIAQDHPEDTTQNAVLHFTRKTAIELLGSLWKWIRTRPDFLRSALEMISSLLLAPAPGGVALHIAERQKQLQQAAAIAFKDICYGGKSNLAELAPQMCQVFISTMHLPIRMHLFVVEGVAVVVSNLKDEEAFRTCLEQIITPLVNGLNSERERANVLSEILDRLTTVIRMIRVAEGSAKAASLGTLINNVLWPLVRQSLSTHPGDAKVVEKCCRVLKHSMRCVPDLFCPKVPEVAETLVLAFQQHQHSSYLYSAEILANSYASDPQITPVLAQLFHELSGTGLQVLSQKKDQLEELTELVEDFYGMHERYLRYAPMIVLEAPTLGPALQLWLDVIFVQQKDAIEAVIAFIEAVLGLVGSANAGFGDSPQHVQRGQILRPQLAQVAPGLLAAIFKLIVGVPTRYVREAIPCLVEGIRDAFPQEFPGWLEASFQQLPPAAVSNDERPKFGQQLVAGDSRTMNDVLHDICYRCEQIALRNRGQSGDKRK